MKLEHVIEAICSTYWAMDPQKLAEILRVVERRAAGGVIGDDFKAAEPRPIARMVDLAAVSGGQGANAGKVAILQMFGMLSQRMGMIEQSSGGTSMERFAVAFDAALQNPEVRSIVLQIDSPGGSVAGTAELAQRIYDARGQKKVVALADSLAASAAYWIGSAAAEFWASPTALVGSIGVVTVHEDISQAAEAAGVRFTVIKAGKFKAEGNPYEPLSEEGLAYAQGTVDDYYSMFVRAVARNRGVSVDAVRNGFGQGRVVRTDPAKAEGMIDRAGTLDDVLVSLRAIPGPNARSRAQLEQRVAQLEE